MRCLYPVLSARETVLAQGGGAVPYTILNSNTLYDLTGQRKQLGPLPPIGCVKAILYNSNEATMKQHDEAFWCCHVHSAVLSAALCGGQFAIRNGKVGYSSWFVSCRYQRSPVTMMNESYPC